MEAQTVITHARLQDLLDTRGVSSVAMPSEFVLSDDDTTGERDLVITHAPNQGGVVSERYAYAAHLADYTGRAFDAWGAAQRLTSATSPLVRGTRSLGGSLVPLRNAGELYREGRVPARVRPSGVSLAKAGDSAFRPIERA